MRAAPRLALFAAVLTAAPSVAFAEPARPAQSDKAKSRIAKQYVDDGLAAQNRGDYDAAISFYQKAYQVVPHPALLFNMAQAHRLAGRTDRALRLYHEFVDADPSSAQAATARSLIAELEARKPRSRKPEPRPRAPEPEPAAPEPEPAVVEASPEPTPVTATDNPGRGLRLWGIGIGVAGVISLGGGIGYGIRAASLSSDASKPNASYDLHVAGEHANKAQIVGLVTGGALIVTGAVLYWRGRVRARADQITIVPIATPALTGLAITCALP